MNTHKTGMRAVVAAAAAGALVLGSAGGVVADPGKAKGPKTSASAEMTKLQNVNIKRHKKIDLADVDVTETALKLRAKVRYSKKVSDGDALQSFEIKLGVFDSKVNGEFVDGSDSGTGEGATAAVVELKPKKKERKVQFYSGDAVIADVWTADQIDVLAKEVATDGKAYICTYSVEADFDAFSQQTRMRLGTKANGDNYMKKTVRDCVKVVNSTPAPPE